MSSEIRKVLIKDDLLAGITDQVAYGVYTSGQTKTTQVFTAISKSTSQISYNINVGSETQVLDRKLQMRNTYKIRVKGTVAGGAGRLLEFGKNAALAAFPVNQSFQTVNCSINNSTVQSNVSDVLPLILKQMTKEDLAFYSSTSPVVSDYYADYANAVNSTNSPFGDYTQSDYVSPNGAFVLDAVTGNTAADGAKIIDITFTTVEPVFISPFLWGLNTSNNQGMYGLSSLSFNFNLASNANRVFRSAKPNLTCELVEVIKSEMILNFITPHPSELLPSTNVLPFYTMPIYKDVVQTVIPANGSAKIVSPSLTLNMIPDRMFIQVRKLNRTINDPDFALPINDISLQVFNQSGILASSTISDLYRYSRESGYTGTFLDWNGLATKNDGPADEPTRIRTSGSYLSLEFARHIPVESWYAPGSLTNTSLQYSISVRNDTANPINAGEYELVLVVQNSGVMTISRGQSSEYLGLLSRADVLDALQQEPVSQSELGRVIGSGFLDKLKSAVVKYAPKVLPVARQLLEKSDNPNLKKAGDVLKMAGYGQSGSGESGGRMGSRLAMRT